ncbi:TadE/TadG family type IV pilus assembly protein [Cellulomonas wangsupingiae]|uniref:Pilus assembly protein n=1 Tax=Cellulomonas wangsupingiae TaxID=2968085 RepID=A0ABY5K0Z3_9CELL|nr:TadE family protein [Cellulomonas wangsupingiae]MCC2335889.1 pilus assembly protein [Cellulomonas wangsupingiae]MCM0639822.1 pilus assembly protein [Cellulomonas wangsupingiae]UUI64114.1 pilus assembly protein [Cellulomonas wangsupingiae]
MRLLQASVRRPSARDDDRGSAAIEVVGAVIVMGVVLFAIVQMISFMIGIHVAHQAARDGARALSLGRSVPLAVARSVPGDSTYRIEYPASDTVRVEVTVDGPIFTMDVGRQVAMPRTGR